MTVGQRPEDMARLLRALKAAPGEDRVLTCSTCGTSDWVFGGIFGLPVADPRTLTVFPTASAPLAMIACRVCSEVRLYSWNMVLARTKDEPQP